MLVFLFQEINSQRPHASIALGLTLPCVLVAPASEIESSPAEEAFPSGQRLPLRCCQSRFRLFSSSSSCPRSLPAVSLSSPSPWICRVEFHRQPRRTSRLDAMRMGVEEGRRGKGVLSSLLLLWSEQVPTGTMVRGRDETKSRQSQSPLSSSHANLANSHLMLTLLSPPPPLFLSPFLLSTSTSPSRLTNKENSPVTFLFLTKHSTSSSSSSLSIPPFISPFPNHLSRMLPSLLPLPFIHNCKTVVFGATRLH